MSEPDQTRKSDMKHIQQIITNAGGLDHVRENYLRITNEPYMPLVIEVVSGPHPNGAYEVSVAHYGEQNGDAMRDPEILFHVLPHFEEWIWTPIFIQQDYLSSYSECARLGKFGLLMVTNPSIQKDIRDFSLQWDSNIAQQGFVNA